MTRYTSTSIYPKDTEPNTETVQMHGSTPFFLSFFSRQVHISFFLSFPGAGESSLTGRQTSNPASPTPHSADVGHPSSRAPAQPHPKPNPNAILFFSSVLGRVYAAPRTEFGLLLVVGWSQAAAPLRSMTDVAAKARLASATEYVASEVRRTAERRRAELRTLITALGSFARAAHVAASCRRVTQRLRSPDRR